MHLLDAHPVVVPDPLRRAGGLRQAIFSLMIENLENLLKKVFSYARLYFLDMAIRRTHWRKVPSRKAERLSTSPFPAPKHDHFLH